jgi:DNA primase
LDADKSHLTHLHQNAQRLIRTLLVVNPYAEQLTFLDTQTRTRRDHMKYLTLIKSIALLHQYQREIKRIERNGQVLEYIEVQPSDIELANQLAHEVLGRTLDELPPQTRKLLSLVYDWVQQQCEAEKINQRDFRFSRRDLRSLCGWSEKQVRVHVQRLTDMEYLLVHRGGRGQSFDYELIYAGEGEDNQPFVSGLLGLNDIKPSSTAGTSSTKTSKFVGSSCPQRGAVVVGSSPPKNGCKPDDTVDIEKMIAKSVEKDLLEKNKNSPSSDSLPLMVMS